MAKIKSKLRLSGRLGDMVICNGKQRSYLRSRPTTVAQPSNAQILRRYKMKVASPFVRAMRPILDLFWKTRPEENKPFLQLMGIVLKLEFEGQGIELKLKYKDIPLSRGTLPGLEVQQAQLNGNVLSIRWNSSDLNSPSNSAYHLVNVIFYNEETNVASVFTGLAHRAAGYLELRLAEVFAGGNNHFWLVCSNHDATNFSESMYLETQKES